MNQNDVGILPDGSVLEASFRKNTWYSPASAETLVMKNIGYWQLHSKPGVWKLDIEKGTRGAEIYGFID